ncbi:hypothetical protein CARUB_v10022194mg [Capsella rubella]|uniref:histone acetyltransferase n=1 Tax=Capsella rubella TaxID=81985 RepID=R0GG40_9BRAS|nr:hypothetical protein CARUB_v10022194mg [Capsella rubella]
MAPGSSVGPVVGASNQYSGPSGVMNQDHLMNNPPVITGNHLEPLERFITPPFDQEPCPRPRSAHSVPPPRFEEAASDAGRRLTTSTMPSYQIYPGSTQHAPLPRFEEAASDVGRRLTTSTVPFYQPYPGSAQHAPPPRFEEAASDAGRRLNASTATSIEPYPGSAQHAPPPRFEEAASDAGRRLDAFTTASHEPYPGSAQHVPPPRFEEVASDAGRRLTTSTVPIYQPYPGSAQHAPPPRFEEPAPDAGRRLATSTMSSFDPYPGSSHAVPSPRFEDGLSDAGRCLNASTMPGSSVCAVVGASNQYSGPSSVMKQGHVQNNPPLDTSNQVKPVTKFGSAHPVPPTRFEDAGRCLNTSTMAPGSNVSAVVGASNQYSRPSGVMRQDMQNNPLLDTSNYMKPVKMFGSAQPVPPPRFVEGPLNAGKYSNASTMLGSTVCDVVGASNSGPSGVMNQDHVQNNPPLVASNQVKPVKKFVQVSTFDDLFMPNTEMIETEERPLNHEKMEISAPIVEEMMACNEGNKSSEVNVDIISLQDLEKLLEGFEDTEFSDAAIEEMMEYIAGTKSPEVNADTMFVDQYEKQGVAAAIELMTWEEGTTSEANAGTVSPQRCNKAGVSLLENLTEEEINLHLTSLTTKSSDQVNLYIEKSDLEEESCHLCGDGKLSFPPPPIYCLSCHRRVGDKGFYYTPAEEEVTSDAQLYLCRPCYHPLASKVTLITGVTFTKSKMVKRNNADNQVMEQYIQCGTCEKWQHQICGLYNMLKDKDKTATYVCPKCLLDERKVNNNMPVPENADWRAKDLPATMLSFFLERRLERRLGEERSQTANALKKNIDDVPEPEALTLRVVYSADKLTTVYKPLADLLQRENYPTEFPYRSKAILVFQKIDGVDVFIFALLVQEFGSECSQPNQRSTYIVYLDSVKYFRPERKTFSGESLRTFVYHEILIGYLEYCKLRGFTKSYIWSCSPDPGTEYIMYSHPKTQQTPTDKKLLQWYESMLKKAVEQGVVMNITNLHKRFFVQTEESTSNMTAARLPYFEGCFWSNHAECELQKIEKDKNNELPRMLKSLTKRKLKCLNYKTTGRCVDVVDVKNILLIQKLETKVLEEKEYHLVVDLNYSCTRCLKPILSGSRWFCYKCKNLHLCESCYDAKEELPGEHIYDPNKEEKHNLTKELVKVTTVDNDIILEDSIFESRQGFLALSQKNNYMFNTLRRAKHSSMMILHHLHASNKDHLHRRSENSSTSLITCTDCKKDVSPTTLYFPCVLCHDYRACIGCYNDNITLRHNHLFSSLPSANGSVPISGMVLEFMNALGHAYQCRLTTPASTESCSYPKCNLVKSLYSHIKQCESRVTGDYCVICLRMSQAVRFHAIHCQENICSIPGCK